jgi:hypothetical protein
MRESAPRITAATDRQIMRTLDGLMLTAEDAAAINPITDRLRPWLVLQNGSRYPLGVYLFGDHQRQVSSRPATWQPQMYDQGLILQDKIAQTLSLGIGASALDAMEQILIGAGITNFVLSVDDVPIQTPVAWPAGTGRAEPLGKLAQQLGCLAPYFDAYGVGRAVMAPDPAVVVPAFSYGPGRIDADSAIEADDSYRAPNRYIVIGASTDVPVVGSYDIPASAPHSLANRGYVVSETIDLPAVGTSAAAVLAARAAYLSDTRSWSRVTFTSPLDPRHDLYAVINYSSSSDPPAPGVYLEVGFSMELWSGGRHDHELARLWGPT